MPQGMWCKRRGVQRCCKASTTDASKQHSHKAKCCCRASVAPANACHAATTVTTNIDRLHSYAASAVQDLNLYPVKQVLLALQDEQQQPLGHQTEPCQNAYFRLRHEEDSHHFTPKAGPYIAECC